MRLPDPRLSQRLISPPVVLGLALAAAVVLATLPASWTDVLREVAVGAIGPGQRTVVRLREFGDRLNLHWSSHFRSANQWLEAQEELQRFKEENRLLAAELDTVRSELVQRTEKDREEEAARLLCSRSVPARILGQQARAFLAKHQLLDVGLADGIEPEALVLAKTAIIDQGSEAGLGPGQLVLHGAYVWGKIAARGDRISSVRTLTHAGYRDLVRVGSPKGAQGILEGTGDPLVRIRRVEATEPISVGDPVFSAAVEGVVSTPLLCGRIARLQRTAEAAHWEIWMLPAAGSHMPRSVAVLKIEVNAKSGAQGLAVQIDKVDSQSRLPGRRPSG